MRILDTFCKAGGAGWGYHLAGHEVVGVDIEPQPNYPFEFHQADALDYIKEHGYEFDAIHASPCCWGYTTLNAISKREHVRMIPAVRELLTSVDKPWVIENVQNAREDMRDPIKLCGSSFDLRVRRHRLFESNVSLTAPPCNHQWQDDTPIFKLRVSKSRGSVRYSGVLPVHGSRQSYHPDELALAREAMGLDWMTKDELNQAIPPAYTEWIGRQLWNS